MHDVHWRRDARRAWAVGTSRTATNGYEGSNSTGQEPKCSGQRNWVRRFTFDLEAERRRYGSSAYRARDRLPTTIAQAERVGVRGKRIGHAAGRALARARAHGAAGRPTSTADIPTARSGHSDGCSKATSTKARRVQFGAPPYPNGSKSSASMMIHAVEAVLGIGFAYHPKGTR
jgi:hypothetical protein